MTGNVGNQASKNKAEPTELMKRVATHKKSSSPSEMVAEGSDTETAERARLNAQKSTEERKSDRLKYRKVKRHVKELEVGNNSRLILFPSNGVGGEWYKMIEFSALYYSYRLAEKMGRKATVRPDNDAHAKARYMVSLTGVEKFIEQFKEYETDKIEKCEDGVIILELKRPLTDDEMGRLMNIEETRRERLHNIVKPQALAPKTYQAMLMLVRQVLPRVRKLDKANYKVVGEHMVKEITELMMAYFCYADGVLSREKAMSQLILSVDKLLAEVSILAEIQVWGYDIATAVGENANNLKRIILKDFSTGKES